MDKTTDELAQILWEYNNLKQTLKKSDCILVLGSSDLRVAHKGAELYLAGYAQLIIFSGGFGRITRNIWKQPEAEVFAQEAMRMGVPKDKILIENKSTNTGDNIIFTRQLLAEKNITIGSFIVVHKPYMLRRLYANFRKQWPRKQFIVTSPNISFSGYFNESISKELVINLLVGDTQRIKEFAERGFQIYQRIPKKVQEAYEELIRRGYIKHLITD
jgi:uncharacterized SAM-binding protein YcdF (DUF218 family)